MRCVCTVSFLGNCQIALQSGYIIYTPLIISVFLIFTNLVVKIVTNCCFHLHPQDYKQGRPSEILQAVTRGAGVAAGLGHKRWQHHQQPCLRDLYYGRAPGHHLQGSEKGLSKVINSPRKACSTPCLASLPVLHNKTKQNAPCFLCNMVKSSLSVTECLSKSHIFKSRNTLFKAVRPTECPTEWVRFIIRGLIIFFLEFLSSSIFLSSWKLLSPPPILV